MLVKKYWDCVTNIGEPGNELSQPLPARIDAAVKKMASTDKFLLTGAQVEALSKVFKFADVEETGYVDVATISTLAVQLLGAQLSESEKETINSKAENKAEKGLLSYQNFIEIMMETMQAMTHWGKLKTALEGYVGFDTVQEQIRKKSLKRGFEFNLMVVGATGLGKSTMVNTLFKGRLSRISSTGAASVIPKTAEVKSVSHVIEEKGVRLKLTITDTPGFGDQINNESCWEPILQFINEQFHKYLMEETSINRKPRVPDSRVHCCLYFIAPTGHRLRPIDVEFMKRLDKCVNIVPVIAKADTLTIEEREAFRRRLREDIQKNNINIYPILDRHDLDEEEARTTSRIRDQLPFAVIGSDRYVTVSGKPVLGRKTKWGLIEVENKNHCEFAQLRDMLIKRNGPTNGDSNVGVKRSHNINENFTDSGLNSTSVGLHDVATGDKKLRRPRASAFTEPGLQGTLRGEDFEIKYPNDSTTKSSNFIGRNGKSGLPPVWDNPASNRKENMNGIKVLLDSEEASEGKSTRRPKTDTILPRVHHDLRKELLISEAQKGKQLPKTIKEPGKSKGLPNVFSNLGKSFVETNQLAVFNRSSFRKNPASLVKDSDTYKHPSTVNDESGYENGRQSQTETPKDRKKKKTTTKKKDVHKGSGKSPNERRESAYVGQNVKEDRANVCVEKPSGPSKKESIKTGEHRATEDSDGMREKPSKQRPGTALERWFKKHKGTVAPAQLDGLNNGATGHLKETEGEFKTKIENLFDGKAPEAYDSCVLTTPHVKRVFVSECQENVSVLLVKDDSLGKNTEMETVQDEVSKRNDVSLRVPQKDLAEKAIKIEISGDEATRKDVEKDKSPQKIEKAEQETCQAKSDQENNHRRQKATPSCSSNMQESNGLLKEEIGHIDKEREDPTEAKPFTLPYPVKRDLLKETVDNICLASLNDGATNQPKITIKKELDTKRLDRNDFYREKKRNISVSDVGDLASVFESGGELKSLLQHSKTVSVQQRLEKTSKDISLKDKTPRQCNQLGHVLRQLPIVYDSPDSETFEIKDNVVSREPMKATRSPRNLRFPRLNGGGVLGNQVNSATGHPLVPPLGRNKTTKKELNPALKMVTVNAERDAVLQKTIEKPKWDTGKPCLPSIESQRTQMVEDILEKRRRKQEKEMADDFEGWGNYDDEPEEIKRILERPLTAKSPTYPAHWRPVPTQRSLGREGQRCRLGVISKKPEKRFLPESASEDLTNIQLEEPEELYHASHREKTPPKRLPLFDTDTYKRYVNKHEEPTTWCKTLRVRQRSAYSHFQERYLADDNVDIEDVEEFF